jgi:hypothetical protein
MGELTAPKTKAGIRDVAIPPGLVDLLARHIPAAAAEAAFVFPSNLGTATPISYFNVANRGFNKVLKLAGLDDKGIPSMTFGTPQRRS